MMGAKSPTAILTPNLKEAERFLSIIAPDGAVTFQTYDDNKQRKSAKLRKILHGNTEENLAKLVRLNQAGAGICFMVNRGDSIGRKKENVQSVRALFVDIDEDSAGKIQKIKNLRDATPRFICESSHEKYHAYWLIDGDLPLDSFSPLQKHFIATFGGDPAPCDLPRVMRLPGFFHNKGTPFLSQIVGDNSKAKPLPVKMLIEKVKALSSTKVPAQTGSHHALNTDFQVEAGSQGLPLWLPEALEHINPNPYDEWLKVGMALHHATEGSEDGLKTFVAWSSTAENYDKESCQEKWNSFCDSQEQNLSIGTIHHLAKNAGWAGSSEENLTDTGNGKRLIRHFGKDLRFVPETGKWLMYSNGQWKWDTDGGLSRRAKKTTDLMLQEAIQMKDNEKRQRLIKYALASESSSRLKSMVELAATEQEAVLHQSRLNRNPDLLGIANGALNLKTGEIHPGRREDYLTKKANVELTSRTNTCPVWLGFLEKVMDGSLELIKYLQRAMGYSLTGHTREQCLFFLYGNGANGKSTFLNVLQGLMGDYCMAIDPETIMLKSGSGGATPEIARLMGARAVITNEIEEGKRLAENRIKQMTGGDIMIARHLYKDPFEFKPKFKIWMAGNHKPAIKGTDHAIWRRIHLVPFEVSVPKKEQDPRLAAKLKAELPGILQWAVEGTMEWRKRGLKPPKQIKDAVEEYKDEMDTLGNWLEEHCIFYIDEKTKSSILYQCYHSWCQLNGHYPRSQTRFGTTLKERGFRKIKAGTISWAGIALKPLQEYTDV